MNKERVIAKIKAILESSHAPSASVTVYDNGEYIHLPVGLKDIDKKAAADENTLYPIGSSTKAFVAEALCILADDGTISLDDPVNKHIPEFAMYDPYVTNALTVRDILCHRCGLPRHEFSWYSKMNSCTPKELVGRLKYLKPFAPFRYTWNYQNHMFMLAGYLVERVTGAPWEDFVAERILKPLGMTRTNFRIEALGADANRALGYEYDRKADEVKYMPYKEIAVIGAAGCINSSTEQMARWVALQLNGGKFDGKQVVSEKLITQCHTPQMNIGRSEMALPDNKKDMESYGMGWFIETYRGRKVVHHGGNINGFSAMQAFVPGTGFGFSILTNLNATYANMAIQYMLIDEYFGDTDADWNEKYSSFMAKMIAMGEEAKAKTETEKPQNAPASFAPEAANGKYEHPGYGDIVLEAKNGVIEGMFGDEKLVFTHFAYNHFTVMMTPLDDVAFPAVFETDMMNKVTGVAIEFEPMIGEKIMFKKQK